MIPVLPLSAMRRFAQLTPLCLALTLLVSGCDLGGDSAEKLAAAKEAEGKAIGGACRHAGRAIEDCYALNKKADKAAVFAGWRDMNDYMRENKIEAVAPQLSTGGKSEAKAETKKDAEPAEAKAEAKADTKPGKAAKAHES
jgi:hypothetical protein